MNKALLVIDLQNDYFPGGLFPIWNANVVLANIVQAITRAREQSIPVILIQHVANSELGISPFFNKNTWGAEIHPHILAAAPNALVVVKEFTDGFEKTTLADLLSKFQVRKLFICGMMTQNCVTHTAISKSAEKYEISVLTDCCSTVSEILHNIALFALSTRVSLVTLQDIL
ncbi:isochorismatase [Candidatus Nitrosoglobus terrae]|uniref:Isochorismatase n=1 Tax=Candidatus Nitrosoglobus terrae TaxID=1630141 RepID=A0A1Q2SKN1_9GAMM|nr:cysteine hydrolase family protein [Candidatus Nitrosoglobus terrae]BAW79667.1 isochorismatase [Candidatus Nitrosoglobus terrae]